ncbi:MAG: flap endonuclease-1 [Methanomassiliicoccales archaeon]|nr:flap endonuclease-1 [Methanomassiliicoccales archaeon]NYT15316.1 flap endonuclease-1 [Methanomassiliicoccales archaeon]
MGVNLSDIVPFEEIEIEDLRGRTIAIDAYNAIYQFLSVIRQPDGTPLKDFKGRVTSHLSGLLYRNVNLIESGILPAYVFDGIPSKLKKDTIAERGERRAKAQKEWKDAVERGDLEVAFSKATQSSRITNEIVESSRILLTYLGIPVVQAPEEGEAQAAFMASKGDVWAASSQDFDSLLFGAPRLVRNLTLTGRRKLPGSRRYRTVNLEMIELNKALEHLGVTRDQLIDICIMMGTDFNPGIKGIGPKKALTLIKEYGDLERSLDAKDLMIESFKEIRSIFLDYEKMTEYDLTWKPAQREKVMEFLVEEHDFTPGRVESALNKLESEREEKREQAAQSKLDMFS